jgi:hypothetical protein
VQRRLREGLAAGFVATLVMTALMVAAPAMGGPAMPLAAARAALSVRTHAPAPALLLLVGLHFAYGSLAGALFTAGARAITVGRGLAFGFGLWALAGLVYAPLVGLGPFAAHQPGLAAVLLPGHLLYGVALGALAPRGEIVHPIGA